MSDNLTARLDAVAAKLTDFRGRIEAAATQLAQSSIAADLRTVAADLEKLATDVRALREAPATEA